MCSMVLKSSKRAGRKGIMNNKGVYLKLDKTMKSTRKVAGSAPYGTPHLTPSYAKQFSCFMLMNCFKNKKVLIR